MTVRSHARILVSILRDDDFIALSPHAQRMYFVILAQKTITNAGVTPWMPGKWARSCRATSEADVVAAVEELQSARFVFFDLDTDELLIRTFIRNDGIVKQPNVLKNALRAAVQIESETLREGLAEELLTLRRADCAAVAEELAPGITERSVTSPARQSKDTGNASLTLVEGFQHPLTLPEPFLEPCGVGDGDGVGEEVLLGEKREGSRARTRVPAREATPSPLSPRCPKHRDVSNPPPCGGCRDARLAFDAAVKAESERAAAADAEARRAEVLAKRAEIEACALCDDRGYVSGRVCIHDPEAGERAKRGIAAAREAVRR